MTLKAELIPVHLIKMDFDQSKFKLTPYTEKVIKPWGYEIIYTPKEAEAVGKILHVLAGKRLSLQYHDVKTETLCLIKGRGKIVLSNNQGKLTEIEMELFKGYYITPGQHHRVIAITDMDFIEASTPERGNTFRIEDDAKRGTETEAMRESKNRGWDNNQ